MKKNKFLIYIFNIILVLSIFYSILLVNRVSPFGNNVLGISDGLAQFKPMLFDLSMKIKSGLFSSYSFNNGLGNPTIFNLLYYLGSPINIIALLFRNPDKMYLAVITIKIIITTCCITFYASKKTDNFIYISIAALSYVFCTWFLVYYYYLAWVDIFMIFPLYHYGLEKIINKKISYCYIFCLSYMIMTNFYLTFSICIYTLFYFIIYELFYIKSNFKNKLASFIRIFKGTILSFLLSFVVIYSLIILSKKCGIKLEHFSKSMYFSNFPLLIKSLFYGDSSFVVDSSTRIFPNISCNFLILINLIYYFFNKNIRKRDKIFALIVIVIIILVFSIDYLDFILNFFHIIRGLNHRYSFLVSFLMVSLFLKNCSSLSIIDKDEQKRLLISAVFCILLYLSVFTLFNSKFISLIFALCYLIVIILWENNKLSKILLLFLVSLQTFIIGNNIMIIKGVEKESCSNLKYKYSNEKFRINYDDLAEHCENLFYDNSNLYNNSKTGAMMTSMTYSSIIYLARDLGNDTFKNTSMRINKENIFSKMIFNERNRNIYDRYLEKIYSVKKGIKDIKLSKEKIVDNIDKVTYGMTGMNTVFKDYKIKGEIAFNMCWIRRERIAELKEKVLYYNNNYIYDELFAPKNDCEKKLALKAYDTDKIDEVYNYLKKNQIQYTYYSDSKIEGTINVEKDQLIFTSIPYDKDWDVYLDGKKIKPIKLLNSLLGIETTPGKHKIKLEYKEHIIIPNLVSIFTFLGIMIKLILDKIKRSE